MEQVKDVSTTPAIDDAPDGRPWDGRKHSYRPSGDWKDRISPSLRLHTQTDDDLDPVTYEILRNRLWTINLAHGETLTRISGSPVFASLDFNMCILSEDGETVMNAPYIQYLNAGAPYAVRYVLEHLSASPGIGPGDMFLTNDPWISAVHQMDVLIVAPVFVEGELFAWVSNAGHQYDLGGIAPGGWPQNAVDVFADPIVIPPFKIVEAGERRSDLEGMYLRQSRMPDFVALDLRAALGGATYARNAVAELCAEFGAVTVKGAMKKILDQSEKSFSEKLKRIPDGTWSDRKYIDQRMPGERKTYALQVNMTKQGDRLIIDNEGTDPEQAGSVNFAFICFAGGVLGLLSVNMLHEQLFSVGGAERRLEYRVTPGTLSATDYPAAVAGGIMNVLTHMTGVQSCISRMLVCDPDLAQDAIAGGPDWPLPVVSGTDSEGNYFGQGLLEGYGQGSGARATLDGVNTSGPYWSPLSRLLNCESVEQWYPLMYLYRRELEDSGGAGRTRGGVGLSFAITPYRARSMNLVTNTGGLGNSAANAEGLFGGYPLPAATTRLLQDTDLNELFADGRVPAALDEITSTTSTLIAGKSNGTKIVPGDVLEVTFMGGGGYGDPLLREPQRVVEDLADGYVTADTVRRVYGVVLQDDGSVNHEATMAARAGLMVQRSSWQRASDRSPGELGVPQDSLGRVHDCIEAFSVSDGGEPVLACAACGHVLCHYTDDYKRHALVSAGAMADLPSPTDPSVFLDDELLFNCYCCPGCQVLLTTEVTRSIDEALPDMLLVLGGHVTQASK
jgi:N-methylhydantoinase B